jgi:hypothetical protein
VNHGHVPYLGANIDRDIRPCSGLSPSSHGSRAELMRGQTDYRSCDVACTGVYDSTCDLAQNGLSDCVTCSKQFVNLDKKYFLRYGKKLIIVRVGIV